LILAIGLATVLIAGALYVVMIFLLFDEFGWPS
jgi:hypothetical protein